MKLVQHFDSFLTGVVNLNTTRLQQLETSVAALKDVIRNSDWLPRLFSFEPQGSWALKTIIKPVEGKAFDADLLILIAEVVGWDARKYLTTLREIFAAHGLYADKVRRYSHCVTIEYAVSARSTSHLASEAEMARTFTRSATTTPTSSSARNRQLTPSGFGSATSGPGTTACGK